jgi:hypothetical protein
MVCQRILAVGLVIKWTKYYIINNVMRLRSHKPMVQRNIQEYFKLIAAKEATDGIGIR